MITTVQERWEAAHDDELAAMQWLEDNHADGRSDGHLAGKLWQPRELAGLVYDNVPEWRAALQLWTAVAVCLSESQGYEKAYNDNLDNATGAVKTRDVSLWEINIPKSAIGTQREQDLYDPVKNVQAAFAIWDEGGWKRWMGYTSGVYLRPYYAGRAALGCMNFLVERANAEGGTMPLPVFTLKELHAKLKW